MSIKQEQEEARTEVEEIAPNVLRMQLPIAIPGLRHVNMYCFRDADGATVVDPGLPDEATWVAIRERLRQADLEVRHVHTVLITHSHPDHFGGAARFRAEAGSRIVVHEAFSLFGERPELAEPEVSVEDMQRPAAPGSRVTADCQLANAASLGAQASALAGFRIPWGGAPPDSRDRDHRHWERIRASAPSGMSPPITHTAKHGSRLRLGGCTFEVVHTPGHTADHMCLFDRETGTLLAGDHILPSITPHISGLGRAADPLQAFYDSLDRVLELGNITRCLPAHGHPFDDVQGRIAAIKRHHHERLARLVAIAARLGPATVPQFSQELFAPAAWGIMAESETYAHLEHLKLHGQAESHTGADGLLVYVA